MKAAIQDILRRHDGLTAIVPAERIWNRRLVRPNSTDPEDVGYIPTPEAFEAEPPNWLLTNIVVGSRITRGSDQRPGAVIDSLTARWNVTLAYYCPPDQEDILADISWQVSVAFGQPDALIPLPNGRSGRAVPPHDISAAVPVPEFPGAGYVMLERFEIPTLWIGG